MTVAKSMAASSGLRPLTNEFRTAVPAIVNDIIMIRLVKKAKTQNTRWVLLPNLAFMTCRNVFAPGALIFNMMDSTAKRMIWMVAPPGNFWLDLIIQLQPFWAEQQQYILNPTCIPIWTWNSIFAGHCGWLQKGCWPSPLRDNGCGSKTNTDFSTCIKGRIEVVCIMVNVLSNLESQIKFTGIRKTSSFF